MLSSYYKGKAINKIIDTATSAAGSSKSDAASGSDTGSGTGAGGEDGTTEKTGSTVHAVGAAAITVIINSADSHIDSTGTINSGAVVNLDSSATTMATTISDATTITKTKASKDKVNKTIDNSSAIETRPEKYDQLEQSGGLDVTIHGGSYTTQNTNIKVSQRSDGGGTTFVNKGGKVTRGADGSVVIDGGTTTISNANIDLSAIPSGTIIWTGDADTDTDYVEFVNGGKTITTNGATTTTYEGGIVKVAGGQLTVKVGYVLLSGATLTITDGKIFLTPGSGFSSVINGLETTITGAFTIKSVTGGDLTMTAERGTVKRNGWHNNGTADAIVASCTSDSQITRTGGTLTTDETGVVDGVKNGEVKVTGDGQNLIIDNDLVADVTAGTKTVTGADGAAKEVPLANVTMTGQKDSLGNAVTTAFNGGTTAGDGATTGASEMILVGGTIRDTRFELATKSFTIYDAPTYRVVGGKKSTGASTGANYVSYAPADDDDEMTIYIDGTFTMGFSGTYKGDFEFNNVTFTRKGERQTGSFALSGATTVFNGATLTVTNGRIVVSGAGVRLVNDNGKLTVEGGTVTLLLGNLAIDAANGTITITGGTIGSVSKPAKTQSTSLGAALSVVVIDHDSTAHVSEQSTVKAKGLRVNASTPMASSDARSHAGFSNSDNTIAGAISVQVNGINTRAEVKEGAKVTLSGGPLSVTASAKTNTRTIADSSAKAASGAEGVGVGAGLAIDVTGIDTIATVADGTLTTTGALDGVDVTAAQTGNATISAKAGSAGGTSVTPALALGVAGSTVEAYLGTGNALMVTGDANIKADNRMIRAHTGDAAAAGGSVGVGGAFGIAVLNDSTTARLNRSVKSARLNVTAKGVQRTTNTVKAGANGSGGSQNKGNTSEPGTATGGGSSGTSGDSGDSGEGDSATSEGDSDAQADQAIGKGAALGQLTGSAGLSGSSITDMTKDRQKAQTSEGSVSVAAAFGLTVANNEVLAEIIDGYAIETTGDLNVLAYSDTDSKISASAAATKSKIGVGAAVSINIIDHDTKAFVGDTTLKSGGNLMVVAAQLDDSKSNGATDDDIVTLLKEYMTDMVQKMADGVLNAAGLTGFVNLIHGTLMEKLEARWESRTDLLKSQKEPVAKAAISMIFSKIADKLGISELIPKPDLSADLTKVAEDLASDIYSDLFDLSKLKMLLSGDIDQMKQYGAGILNKGLTELRNGIFGFLCAAFGQGEDAPASTITTWSVAGAGASDVGVAGSVAIAVVTGDTIATIADHTGTARTDDIVVVGTTTVSAESAETFDTVATAAVTDAGAPDKNSDAAGKADANTTTTTTTSGTTTSTGSGATTGSGTGTGSGAATGTGGATGTPSNADAAKGVGVGASFGMVYADLTTEATVGKNRSVRTGGLDVHATAANKAETFAVAGTDPLEDTSTSAKKIAIDAAVALNIIHATTKAVFETGSKLAATGMDITEKQGDATVTKFTNDPVKVGERRYGVAIYAATDASTLSKASGFACGDSTAVGAAVAVNIPTSNTTATFGGTGSTTGQALVEATVHDADEAVGTATAMGADLQRYFSKFANGVNTLEEWANKLSSGEVKPSDSTKKKGDNKTADSINDELDKNKNSNEHADGSVSDISGMGADSGASLSTNLLNTQDVRTEEKAPTSEGTAAAVKNSSATANPETAQTDDTNFKDGDPKANNTQSSKKVMVAAAIAVNITNHLAKALMGGSLTAAGFDVLATNNANYRTYATGAAATGKESAATIGAAVAVGVNNNKTHATINGAAKVFDATSADSDWKTKAKAAGPVNVIATYTQNMDGVYAGLLGAQSIAGAASGKGSTVTVAGAVSVLVSNSETAAQVADNGVITGGDIVVKAYDKSKLAVRAGALTASGGSTVGVGASFALVYGNNVVRALVGDKVTILGTGLTVSGEKAIVTFSDYAVGKDWSTLYEIKPSVKKSDQPNKQVTEAKDQAIITVTPTVDGSGKTSYNIDLNVDTDTVLGAIDLLNFLSSTNYYAEAIAGAIQTGGDSKVNVAGSFAFVFAKNAIEALIGDACDIDLTDDMTVEAAAGTNARMIAGAFSVSSAKVGVGASVAVYVDKGSTKAAVGTDGNSGGATSVNAGGAVTVAAHGSQPDPTWGATYDADGTVASMPSVEEVPYESSNVLVIAVAPGISTSGNVGVGAVVPVIVTENSYTAEVADGVTIIAGDDVTVYAQDDAKLLPISFSVGAAEKVAVGGTVQVLIERTKTIARVGNAAKISSQNGSVRVAANSEEFLVTVLAAASVSTKVSVAGVINVIVTRSDTEALVGDNAVVSARQDVSVTADSETFMVAVSVSFAGSAKVAAGGVVNVFVFDRDVCAKVGKRAKVTALEGDVRVSARAKDYSVIVVVGGAAAGKVAVTGTIPVIVSSNRVEAIIGSLENPGAANERVVATGTELIAEQGSIGILADYDTKMYVAAGGFSGGDVAVGATVLTTVVDNDVLALVGHGAVLAAGGGGSGIATPSRTNKRKGITVSATSNETFLAIAISGAGGTNVAVAGVVNTGVYSNVVHAIIYGGGRTDADSDNDAEGDLATLASSNSNIYLVGGSLDGAGTVGVGATVTVLTYDKDVIASVNAHEAGIVHAHNVEVKTGNVETDADGTYADKLYIFAVSISGAGTVAVGAGSTVLYFDNSNTAELGGAVNASGNVMVHAENDSHLINGAGAVAGSGTASVTGIVAVTYFRTKTIARVVAGADVDAAGAVDVTANSAERVDADVIGISGAGTTAVSGTVAVVVTKVTVQAYVGTESEAATATQSTVDAASLNVAAHDDFKLLSIAGTIAGSGAASVGVTAVVAKSTNNVEAYVGRRTVVACTGDVSVEAIANRDVQMYLATVAGSGVAGIGATVLVTVVGGNIDQDSADTIAKDSDGTHYFKADEFWQKLVSSILKDMEYLEVEEPSVDDIAGYYERNGDGTHVLTSDAALVSGKTYYIEHDPNSEADYRIAAKLSGTEFASELEGDGVHHTNDEVNSGDFSDVTYTAVTKPDVKDIKTYYEKKSDGTYERTKDTALASGKTYYTGSTSDSGRDAAVATAADLGKSATATTSTSDVPVIEGDDIARAYVGANAHVAGRNITIDAKSHLLLDAMAFTAAGAGTAAVATNIAVGITYANAAAYTETGSRLTATGDVRVTAWTGSTKVANTGDEVARNEWFVEEVQKGSRVKNEEKSTNDSPVYDEVDISGVRDVFSGRSVRVVGAAGAGAMVGVSPVVAYLGLDSNSYAYIAGDVTRAHNLTVKADTHFPVATAATFGLAAGAVAVTASAATVVSNGVVFAGIVGTSTVEDVFGTASVLTDADFDATTFAATISGAAVAVNGAVAVSADHMTIHTFVGQATTMGNVANLVVTSDGDVRSNAYLIGGTAGAIAVGVGVAVATVDPIVLTYVGTTPLVTGRVKEAIAGASGTNRTAHVGALTMANNVTTSGQALTLGVAAGAISVGTNVLVIDNDTLARVGINEKNVIVDGATVIDANISAKTDTEVLAVAAGAIAVGVNVYVSNLTADNRAIVDTTGSTVKTGSLAVYAGRSDKPNVTVANAQGVGSVNAAIAVAVNVAVAENDSVNNAEVLGTGTLVITGGAVTVEANGRATARAQMGAGPVTIAGARVADNNAFATVKATQEAKIENATVNTNGGAVNVISNFNLGTTPDKQGATSLIGTNGTVGNIVDVSLIGIGVSTGKATMDATARAMVRNANINVGTGAVNVRTNAVSYAKSDVISPVVTVQFLGVGVLDSRAEAKGTFESLLGLRGASTMDSANVLVDYESEACAGNGPENAGVMISPLANVSVNVAHATTNTTASAGLTGSGTLAVAGALNVQATGASQAKAEGRTPKVAVGGCMVAVNDAKATQSVTQSAFSTFSGVVSAGAFQVLSKLGTEAKPVAADAVVGGTKVKGANVSLIEGTSNTATSLSSSKNSAYVTVIDPMTNKPSTTATDTVYTVRSAKIAATTYADSDATASSAVSVALATISDLEAYADSQDNVNASMSAITLNATNDVDVNAHGMAHAHAQVSKGVAVGGTSVAVARAYANLGTSSPQSVQATIGNNTTVVAGGNVSVSGKNYGSTEGKVTLGQVVAVGDFANATFESNSNLKTAATVGDNTIIKTGGSINVLADSLPTAKSTVTSSGIGIAVSADTTWVQSTTKTTVDATVGKNAELIAGKSVSVVANGSNTQSAITKSDGASGFVAGNTLYANIHLTRTVSTSIGAGTKISADFGGVDIHAAAGTADEIKSEASASAGGFVGISKTRTKERITSTVKTIIAAGVSIENTFGTTKIYTDSSMRYFYNSTYVHAKGVGVKPDAYSEAHITLTGDVVIGSDNAAKTRITADNVEIDSHTSALTLVDYAYARGGALGANVDAHVDDFVHVDNKTTARNAEIRGYDTVVITSTLNPSVRAATGDGSSDGNNVYSHTYASISAIGAADSKAYMALSSSFTAVVDMANTAVYGADIDVVATNNLKYMAFANGYKSSFFASLNRPSSIPPAENVTALVNLADTCAFYVGDAAAGIAIDVSGADDDPLVRAVGIRGEREIWTIVKGEGICLGTISNPLKGTLDIETNHKGSITKVNKTTSDAALNVYDQNLIPYVTVTNRTSLDLFLNAITVENADYLSPDVNGKAFGSAIKTGEAGGIDGKPVRPVVSIVNEKGADVTFSNLIANLMGSVSFTWTDPENRGSLIAGRESVSTAKLEIAVAPIWAHELIVSNAQNVGSADKRVNVYSTWSGDVAPTTSVEAAGDVYLGITDVKTVAGTAPATAAARDSAVNVGHIVGGATTNLYINTAITIYRDPTKASTIVTMPTPGTPQYADDRLANLTSDVTLDAKALVAYRTSSSSTGSTYLLPNGTMICTDADGVVTRVIEGDLDVDLSECAITKTMVGDTQHLIATLKEGVTLDLTTGYITLAEETTFEMLLSSVNGEWLKNLITSGSKVIIVDEAKRVTVSAEQEDGTIVTMEVPATIEMTASALITVGSVTYYQLVGTYPHDYSYTLAVALGIPYGSSVSSIVTDGDATALHAWLEGWMLDGTLTEELLTQLVDRLIADGDYNSLTAAEKATVALAIMARDNFAEWLLDKLKLEENADVLAHIDTNYGEHSVFYGLIDGSVPDGFTTGLSAWIDTFGTGELEALVASLVQASDYTDKDTLAGYLYDARHVTDAFYEWLYERLSSNTTVQAELDGMTPEGAETFTDMVGNNDPNGRLMWAWIDDATHGDEATQKSIITSLITSGDMRASFGKPIVVAAVMEYKNGQMDKLASWLTAHLIQTSGGSITEASKTRIEDLDRRYRNLAADYVEKGDKDGLLAFFNDMLADHQHTSVVSSLLSNDELKSTVCLKAGLNAAGTQVTNSTMLASWLLTHLKGQASEIEALDELTTPKDSGQVYLLSYDSSTKTMAAWQAVSGSTVTGSAKDYIDYSKADPTDTGHYAEDGVTYVSLSEIWGTLSSGSSVLIGFLADGGSNTPGQGDSSYVRSIMRHPDVAIDNFLGTDKQVTVRLTFTGNVYYHGGPFELSRATGIAGYYYNGTLLTALKKTAEGYYYVDTSAIPSDAPDAVKLLYQQLSGKIWTSSLLTERTSITTYSHHAGDINRKPTAMEWNATSTLPTDAGYTWSDASILRFCYKDGVSGGHGQYVPYLYYPCEYTVRLNYVDLVPVDVTLAQSTSGSTTTTTIGIVGHGATTDAYVGTAESRLTIYGPFQDVQMKRRSACRTTRCISRVPRRRAATRSTTASTLPMTACSTSAPRAT